MSDGLATTFRVLSKTDNQSAVLVLLPALDSPSVEIQDGALSALLTRRSTSGQEEILRRIPSLSQRWKYIISQHSGRLTGTMRNAVLGSDEAQCQNACTAGVMFSAYDLIPTLLIALGDATQSKADMAAQTLMHLVRQLYDELAHPDENGVRRDLKWIHQHTLSCLETSVQRFGRHKRREVIEAFLLLTNANNAVLNKILENPHHVSFLVIVDIMSRSPHVGVMRLVLDYFNKPQMPSSVLSVAGNRCDLKFIRYFLYKVGKAPSAVVRQNLKRIVMIAWLKNVKNIVNNLDDDAQHSLVVLAMASGIARMQAFSVVEYVLGRGKPGGRREAARALAVFNGAEANELALRALHDADPQVQANVIPQLRRRSIPGMLPRLVEMLDNPQRVVRQAAREALAEFSFERFIGSFDMMDDDIRESTAALVKKVDKQTIPLLSKELQSAIRSRRLRGLEITRIMDIVDRVEELIVDMLHDEDHILRAEAAATLGKCRSPFARRALEEALRDSSISVQEAAQRSLSELS